MKQKKHETVTSAWIIDPCPHCGKERKSVELHFAFQPKCHKEARIAYARLPSSGACRTEQGSIADPRFEKAKNLNGKGVSSTASRSTKTEQEWEHDQNREAEVVGFVTDPEGRKN